MTASPSYEVVILGGGPAGCAAALALGRLGVGPVLIVEAGGYDAARIGESIPPDARILLEKLGVWNDFVREQHEPCLGSCSSWGDDEPGYNDYLFNPHGNGWHLDRRRFDSLMVRKATEGGAELALHTTFASAEDCASDGFELKLKTAEGSMRTVGARFVIDAAGSRSRFARARGARPLFNDRLLYVAAFMSVPPVAGFSRLTMLEAVECGWWYAAKLPGECVAVGFASDPEIIKLEAMHTKEGWTHGLKKTRHLSLRLAGSDFVEGNMLVRNAHSFILDRTCGGNWLAAGDAASAYDPISSQGIYKAMFDGLKAAKVAAAHLSRRGSDEQSDEYHSSVVAGFADYLRNRNYFYGLERRWPSAPFWSRRRARSGVQETKRYDE